jgi:hypothetical protein
MERGNAKAAPECFHQISAQVEAIQRNLEHLSIVNVSAVSQSNICSICDGTDHLTINCNWGRLSEGDMEQVNTFNNNFKSQNNLYSNTYNLGWRNHPNFSWRNNQEN